MFAMYQDPSLHERLLKGSRFDFHPQVNPNPTMGPISKGSISNIELEYLCINIFIAYTAWFVFYGKIVIPYYLCMYIIRIYYIPAVKAILTVL